MQVDLDKTVKDILAIVDRERVAYLDRAQAGVALCDANMDWMSKARANTLDDVIRQITIYAIERKLAMLRTEENQCD